jgi:hypothetical protein
VGKNKTLKVVMGTGVVTTLAGSGTTDGTAVIFNAPHGHAAPVGDRRGGYRKMAQIVYSLVGRM